MNSQIICEHPNIILNPSLDVLVSQYKHYVLNGTDYRVDTNGRTYVHFNKSLFYQAKEYVTHDNIDEYVVINDETGETYPIFMEVPCGHCIICHNRKQRSFVQRCRLESQLYDCYPWFVTLTYRDNNLPVDGVSVRDCQLFMKRFRVNLFRHGYFHPIRYVLTSEYGCKTHRPHYHLIIWNIKSNTFVDYQSIVDILNDSWCKGFTQSRIIDLKDDKSFYYTTKYLYKDSVVPEGCNPTFMLYSRKGGSIGAPFLDSIKKKIQSRLVTDYKFLDKWTNKLIPLRFDSYVLNRIFPSKCKLIPSDLRVSAAKFKYYFEVFKQTDPELTFLFDKTNEYIDSLCDNIFIPIVNSHVPSLRDFVQDSSVFGKLEDYRRRIERCSRHYSSEAFDFGAAEKAQKTRDLFLSKCFQFLDPINIADLGYSLRRQRQRSKSLEYSYAM